MTNAFHVLAQVDNVVVITDGEISEMGSYQELIQRPGAFADLLRSFSAEEPEDRHLEGIAVAPSAR